MIRKIHKNRHQYPSVMHGLILTIDTGNYRCRNQHPTASSTEPDPASARAKATSVEQKDKAACFCATSNKIALANGDKQPHKPKQSETAKHSEHSTRTFNATSLAADSMFSRWQFDSHTADSARCLYVLVPL